MNASSFLCLWQRHWQVRAGVKLPPRCIARILRPLLLSHSPLTLFGCFLVAFPTAHKGIPLEMGGVEDGIWRVGVCHSSPPTIVKPPCVSCASHGQSHPLCRTRGRASDGKEANGRTHVTHCCWSYSGCGNGQIDKGADTKQPPSQ